jgi:hypothetical protein
LFWIVAKNVLATALVGAVGAGGGEDVARLPVEPLLRGADVPDPRQQFFEVVSRPRILEPLVLHRETLDQILREHRGGPLAKLHGPRGGHAVPDRQDHIQVVDLDLAPNLAGALCANYQL